MIAAAPHGVVKRRHPARFRPDRDRFLVPAGDRQPRERLQPPARAQTSSAAGLFQFVDQTWLATLKRHGAR